LRKRQESNLQSFYTQPFSRRCPRAFGPLPFLISNISNNKKPTYIFMRWVPLIFIILSLVQIRQNTPHIVRINSVTNVYRYVMPIFHCCNYCLFINMIQRY
jgi:hypothetical protein